jgi:hypothetical protein
LLAALYDLDILAADVSNAHLNAPTRERVYTAAGPDFDAETQGQYVLIDRALYGLKPSGAAWKIRLANTLHRMGLPLALLILISGSKLQLNQRI